jgi:hypothetical protein
MIDHYSWDLLFVSCDSSLSLSLSLSFFLIFTCSIDFFLRVLLLLKIINNSWSQNSWCQYLYFCTSKESKVITSRSVDDNILDNNISWRWYRKKNRSDRATPIQCACLVYVQGLWCHVLVIWVWTLLIYRGMDSISKEESDRSEVSWETRSLTHKPGPGDYVIYYCGS